MVSVIAGLICSANIASLSLLVASQRRDLLAANPDPLVAESLANAQQLMTPVPPRLTFYVTPAQPTLAFARAALPTSTTR
jgi:hypothetical protein